MENFAKLQEMNSKPIFFLSAVKKGDAKMFCSQVGGNTSCPSLL
jgi:hypothetical protein